MSSSPSHTCAKGKIYLSACLPASWDFWIDEEACVPLSTEGPMQLKGEPASMHLPKKERKKESFSAICWWKCYYAIWRRNCQDACEGIHTNTWMPCLWYVNFISQLGLPCHLAVLLVPTTQIPCRLCHMSRRNVLWQTSRSISTSHCQYLKESTLQSSDNPTDLEGIFFTFGKWHIHKFGDRVKVWDHHHKCFSVFFAQACSSTELHIPIFNCFKNKTRLFNCSSGCNVAEFAPNLNQYLCNLLCRRR